MIGQDQDSVGGLFSAQESFIGSMTGLHIWDRNLTQQELTSLIAECSSNVQGNVVAWADFQTGLVGNVEKVQSKFCTGNHILYMLFEFYFVCKLCTYNSEIYHSKAKTS